MSPTAINAERRDAMVNGRTDMDVIYTSELEGVTGDMLEGLLQEWRRPPSNERKLRVVGGSAHVLLAVQPAGRRVVGLIAAISDGCHGAFIALLEVLPEYRGRGIGRELVRRMLRELRDYPCIDLTCDSELQPFYEKCRMQRSVGMVVRDHSRPGRE